MDSVDLTKDILVRIDRIESRTEIGELCTRYCVACDDQDMTSLRRLFTKDAIVQARNGSMRSAGIDEVMAMFEQMFAIRGPSFHWTHDHLVEFDDQNPDLARGKLLAHAETTPDGRPSLAALRYEDAYRREEGRWLIARRLLSFLYYVPVTDYSERFGRRDRVWKGGEWADADYPETLGPWSSWSAAWK